MKKHPKKERKVPQVRVIKAWATLCSCHGQTLVADVAEQHRIYTTKRIAMAHGYHFVPCTITFTPPNKKK